MIVEDLFMTKKIHPMLIGEERDPFDSDDYIYELKLDGIRCIAYLDKNGTDLRNKRNKQLLPCVPELAEIHNQVSTRCILDGELFVLKNGVTDFYEILKYRGHVTLGVSMRKLNEHPYLIVDDSPFGYTPEGNGAATWLDPRLVCIVESMPTDNGSFRQPVFKGIRDDKEPKDCQISS